MSSKAITDESFSEDQIQLQLEQKEEEQLQQHFTPFILFITVKSASNVSSQVLIFRF
jgi:hypothetical protein